MFLTFFYFNYTYLIVTSQKYINPIKSMTVNNILMTTQIAILGCGTNAKIMQATTAPQIIKFRISSTSIIPTSSQYKNSNEYGNVSVPPKFFITTPSSLRIAVIVS